ncbi:hypothetical protein NADFUDRAFT_83629 [Nadsonia fulvescens var. elongata DSM 6958]|uniref:non-specific serine/threonine protein kinase n=1 Tax=Nadsonia fulvescens var. elongata DSM 6958 TaxID=857566 RepID=A0A1E3PH49_9ASCO|nr:hypothetical protein NADFUDRAFT_83629 [Nadsonia fulvescens var. elongata DSM 6958]
MYRPNPTAGLSLFDPKDKTKKFVGTPDYLAPETIKGDGQDEMSDWWSLGCILFEFMYGFPPFHSSSPELVFENILSHNIQWPGAEKGEAAIPGSTLVKDLINRLLCVDPTRRLGSNGRALEIKSHAIFKSINWVTLWDEEASFVPAIDEPDSTDYFDARGAELNDFPVDDDEDEGNEDDEDESNGEDEDNDGETDDEIDENNNADNGDELVDKTLVVQNMSPTLNTVSEGSSSQSNSLRELGEFPRVVGSHKVKASHGKHGGDSSGSGSGGSGSGGSGRRKKLMPFHIPAHVRGQRRHGRRPSDSFGIGSDDFGSFQFKNLPVLEKANKDVINRLKSEHMEHMGHRASISTSSSNSGGMMMASGSPLSISDGSESSIGLNTVIGCSTLGELPLRPHSTTPASGSMFRRPISPNTVVVGSPDTQGPSTESLNSPDVSLSFTNSPLPAVEGGSFSNVALLRASRDRTSSFSSRDDNDSSDSQLHSPRNSPRNSVPILNLVNGNKKANLVLSGSAGSTMGSIGISNTHISFSGVDSDTSMTNSPPILSPALSSPISMTRFHAHRRLSNMTSSPELGSYGSNGCGELMRRTSINVSGFQTSNVTVTSMPTVTTTTTATSTGTTSTSSSPLLNVRPLLHHSNQATGLFDMSPFNSDTEDSRSSALMRVHRRRQLSRRLSNIGIGTGTTRNINYMPYSALSSPATAAGSFGVSGENHGKRHVLSGNNSSSSSLAKKTLSMGNLARVAAQSTGGSSPFGTPAVTPKSTTTSPMNNTVKTPTMPMGTPVTPLSSLLESRKPLYRRLNCLVCDSNPVWRFSIESMLTNLGCLAVAVSNTPEGIRRSTGEVIFDVILTEFSFPRPCPSGEDLVKLIHNTANPNTNTPVICVTSYLKDEMMMNVFNGIIEKPVNSKKLSDMLEKLCCWKPLVKQR